jgi:hypothetical protein
MYTLLLVSKVSIQSVKDSSSIDRFDHFYSNLSSWICFLFNNRMNTAESRNIPLQSHSHVYEENFCRWRTLIVASMAVTCRVIDEGAQ